ncbi:hypothetical protein C8R45DRAFT_1076921 [Mycena sanguinolenta]|nr:hypothetical protein C8R45DRAFT_1076921 [Mycena sanguinolenta]
MDEPSIPLLSFLLKRKHPIWAFSSAARHFAVSNVTLFALLAPVALSFLPPPPSSFPPDYYALHGLPLPPLNAQAVIHPVPLRRFKLVGRPKAGKILGATTSNDQTLVFDIQVQSIKIYTMAVKPGGTSSETKTLRGLKDLAGLAEAIGVYSYSLVGKKFAHVEGQGLIPSRTGFLQFAAVQTVRNRACYISWNSETEKDATAKLGAAH